MHGALTSYPLYVFTVLRLGTREYLKFLCLQETLNGRDGRVNKAVLKDLYYVTADVKLVRAVTYLVDGRRGTTGPDLQADSDDGTSRNTVKESFENMAKILFGKDCNDYTRGNACSSSQKTRLSNGFFT